MGCKLYGINFVSNAISKVPRELIRSLLLKYNANLGKNINFKDHILIDNAGSDQNATNDFSHLTIGNRCYIGKEVFFDLPRQIILENEVVVSAGVMFLTHADCGGRIMSKYYPRKTGKIIIGYGTWIGARAIIMPGVRLGKCCVVGAGAVVTKNFPDYSVIMGLPARIVKTLESG